MRLALISSQPVKELFGKDFPFAGIDCIIRSEFMGEDLSGVDFIVDLTIEDFPERVSHYRSTTIPVLIGSVLFTLKELALESNVPVARFNHWPTFIDRNCIELAVADIYVEKFQQLFQTLNTTFYITADEPGFVSARTVSMIVNEAFLSSDEKVSTEPEIDIAMKLGTNYPLGPFEWCNKIGAKRISRLLYKLSEKNNRYHRASSLTQITHN